MLMLVNEMLLLLMETSNTATTQLIYRSVWRRFVVDETFLSLRATPVSFAGDALWHPE